MRTSLRAIAIGVLMLAAPLVASDKRVEADPNTDFSILKTFVVREGVGFSRNPEIANKLTLRKVEEAVRAELTSRGVKEEPTQPDLIVSFNVTEGAQRGAPPPGMRGAVQLSAGTLIIDMNRRDTKALVWRGTYTDVADAPGILADRLPGHARKLLAEFPPKKKQ